MATVYAVSHVQKSYITEKLYLGVWVYKCQEIHCPSSLVILTSFTHGVNFFHSHIQQTTPIQKYLHCLWHRSREV